MTEEDLFYLLALIKTPQIGDVHARTLLNYFSTPKEIFKASTSTLEKLEGIGKIRARAIRSFKDFRFCESEIRFIEKNKIAVFAVNEPNYPKRLIHCYDAPLLLFFKGTSTLTEEKYVSIVGTRNHSIYGRKFCEQLIPSLSNMGIVVVSGLAYGIDTIVHELCVKYNIPTIGVLAHGLDRIYPESNRKLARSMVNCGGLITPFTSDTTPEKQHFPNRNRITAGLCDAVIVVESGLKGGSLITATLAQDYHKEVFAVPGNVDSEKSMGCNQLIKNNQAAMITDVSDLLATMNWTNGQKSKTKIKQKELFVDLNDMERKILAVLQEKDAIGIDDLLHVTQLSYGTAAAALLNLEMNGLIQVLPGKNYVLSA
jgi:DNA processing protein